MVWPRKNILAEYTHAVPPRFYVPEARAEETLIDLPADEAAHLTRVLRLGAGDPIRVFNGRGDEWDANVEEASKRRVSARLGGRVTAVPEARVPMTLVAAILKGDKTDDVVRDAVMLGVTEIVPLLTARTEVKSSAIRRSGRVERWQRIAVASAKQCGRAVVPTVTAALTLATALERLRPGIMLVEPAVGGGVVGLRQVATLSRAALFVGPEGGWTSEEVERARASGAMLMSLGALTLRADTVPLIALTALRVHLEDF
jgi:16S rRNA (uracil1498-N3)-methyltransferase